MLAIQSDSGLCRRQGKLAAAEFCQATRRWVVPHIIYGADVSIVELVKNSTIC
jgi:hypothetical protein